MYDRLPKEEQRLWHSHKYEVESGMLVLGVRLSPLSWSSAALLTAALSTQTKTGVPETATHLAEQPAMLELQKTYGKTVHTWPSQSLGGDLPLGTPELMMSYTSEYAFPSHLLQLAEMAVFCSGQLPKDPLDARDKDLGVSTAAKRDWRTGEKGYLPKYDKHTGADGWESGRTVQLELVERTVEGGGSKQ